MRRKTFRDIVIVSLIASLLAACQPRPTVPAATPGTTSAASQAAATATAPLPTPTAMPEPPRALLITPEAMSASPSALHITLNDLAQASGLSLAEQTELSAGDLTDTTRVVIVISKDAGLAGLAADHPKIQFLAIDVPEVKPAENVSVIASSDQASQAAFLAGYIAALVSPEWRAAVVASTSPEDAAARDSFLAGGHYLCGICNVPVKPYFFPIAVETAAGDSQTAVATLTQAGVHTVYVAPSLATPEMLSALAAAGFDLVGTSAPTDDLKAHWVATIGANPADALKSLWPDLTAGKGNHQVNVPLTLTDISTAVTPGKQRPIDQLIQDLAAGLVNPNPGETGGG
jgi:hypothetical protein